MRKSPRIVLGFSVVLAAALLGCGGEPAERPVEAIGEEERAGGTAVVCTQNAIESLNTFTSPDLGAADVRLLLFTPLVLYGEGAEYRPYLASGWDWEDGKRTLSFRIRDDLTWHDGRPVTADDVAFTVELAADPEYAYPSGSDFAGIDEVAVIDSVTVEIRFGQPQVGGLEKFIWLPILPRHLLGDVPAAEFSHAEYHQAPIGSGPFRFSQRRSDGSLLFERYDPFPGELGDPYLDGLLIRTITEPFVIQAEMVNGSVDLCVTDAVLSERIGDSDRLSVITLEPSRTLVLPLNTLRPPLDDARVRRALSAGLDRTEIAVAMAPAARPARSPLPESSPWFDPELVQPDADPAYAGASLDSAGWRLNGGDVRRNAGGEALAFELLAPQGAEGWLTVAQAHWREIGVTLELRFMEWASYVGVLEDPARKPDIMALSFSPEKIYTPDSELYAEFHSQGFANLGSYSDPAVDSLIERLRSSVDPEKRQEIYRRVQRRVAEDVPMIFTVYVPRLEIVGPRLRDVTADLNGPFSTVTEWWIPPRLRR
ncbi:MAG: hypothetical protein GWN32_01035 [Gemmatimonadetes bacterium]|nr:hypothetical protein [Gemmatimonadota bacterium]